MRFRLRPDLADVVSDMAALGDLDNQEFGEDVAAFEAWREQTEPVPILSWRPKGQESRPAHVLTRTGLWLSGSVTNFSHARHTWPTIALQLARTLKGGDSGGPVVDDAGRLLGVVSWGSKDSCIPLACATLPGWLLSRMRNTR